MWSSWRDIEHARVKERGYYGIYQIRMVDDAGDSLPIPRITRIDEEGIIYIGRAVPRNTLAKRIREFQSVTQFKNVSHHGGETYNLMRFNLKYSGHAYQKHKLQYKVMRLEGEPKSKIEEEEINTLANYFNKYGELPPCNSSFPEKWGKFSGRLLKLWGIK
jgi:hypothetical protein